MQVSDLKIKTIVVSRGFTVNAGDHFVKAEFSVSAEASEGFDLDEQIDALNEHVEEKVLDAIGRGLDKLADALGDERKDRDATRR